MEVCAQTTNPATLAEPFRHRSPAQHKARQCQDSPQAATQPSNMGERNGIVKSGTKFGISALPLVERIACISSGGWEAKMTWSWGFILPSSPTWQLSMYRKDDTLLTNQHMRQGQAGWHENATYHRIVLRHDRTAASVWRYAAKFATAETCG
ncbi:hypothetical protein BT67DRAFT_28096 [Trichocladium antarcticum]|uniref:Uncharacterized protein n=1 Tax=Trichocladium antarcticum TaxID=1450529 RepID=A0AAN6UW41_9PEZI|nr:hypothetical protein BT67DRAFT_28096 [Trichocladium antarcticum]